jgi:hypothetical protein
MSMARGSVINLEILRESCQVGGFASCKVAQEYGWIRRGQICQCAEVLIGRRKE